MFTLSKALSIILLFSATTFISCSKNNPLSPGCLSGAWAIGVQDELSDFSSAASTYSENPTTENCNAYKNAGNTYLNALSDIKGCIASTNKSEFNDAIDEAKEDVDALDCSN